MSEQSQLEADLHRAMADIYETARREVGYTATRFIQMVAERGGLATAKALLASPHTSDGFATLVTAGRADLTVEALVVSERFRPLFTPAELREARRRLK